MPERERDPQPEFVSPPEITENDILQLNIELQNLGVGTVNHIMTATIQSLIFTMDRCKEGGWTEEDKKEFIKEYVKVKKHIDFEKLLRAREMDKPESQN